MATSSPAAAPLPEVARFIAAEHRMFVGGEWTAARGGATFEVHDPASGEVVAHVPLASAEDVDDAVAAARAAQPVWAGLPPAQRATLPWNLGRRIEDETEVFAQIDSIDNGKPVGQARGWTCLSPRGSSCSTPGSCRRSPAACCPSRSRGSTPTAAASRSAWSARSAVEFPLLMAAWKLAPALAAGNTVVLKPAEQTPLSALRLAELIDEAGFPPGVVNVVTGSATTRRGARRTIPTSTRSPSPARPRSASGSASAAAERSRR